MQLVGQRGTSALTFEQTTQYTVYGNHEQFSVSTKTNGFLFCAAVQSPPDGQQLQQVDLSDMPRPEK